MREIKSFKIRDIEINPPLILSPMAGVTDVSFRRLLKRRGGVGVERDVTALRPPRHHAEDLESGQRRLQGTVRHRGVPLERPEVQGLVRVEDEVGDQARESR